MGQEGQIDQIVNHYRDTEDLLVSDAFSDGGTDGGAHMLGIRLARAGGNQAREDMAAISRYGIWANTVRDHVRTARELVRDGESQERVLEHLRLAANSLSAFADIQALFDSQGIARPPSYLER